MLYEGIPMAYIVEQAGGLAVTGTKSILDLVPETIHQRCPVFMGSKDDVQEVIDLYKKHGL
jgi:fructose-1,6-bisphosphatase I